jgi:16S rRNA processing protein RimM
MEKYLEAGKLINTHGVRGELKMDAWCDSLSDYLKVPCFYLNKSADSALKIEKIRPFGKFLLVKFAGIDDMDAALRYKNKIVYVDRENLKLAEGAVFLADIIGLDAIDDNTGKVFGTIKDITDKGSGNLYEIELLSGGVCLVPAVEFFVKKIDLDTGVYINVIEGLCDAI